MARETISTAKIISEFFRCSMTIILNQSFWFISMLLEEHGLSESRHLTAEGIPKEYGFLKCSGEFKTNQRHYQKPCLIGLSRYATK